MWPHARPAFSRCINVSGKVQIAKSIRLSSTHNETQAPSKGVEKIRLPSSRRALLIQSEAYAYWKAKIRGIEGTPSSVYIKQLNKPLELEIDREGAEKTICTPYGIRFSPTDPLGVKLWEMMNSTPRSLEWSPQSRWIRWPVYYFVLLALVFCFGGEEVPIIASWRFNCISQWLWERDRQKEFEHRGELLEHLQGSLLPLDHPSVQRVQSILGRLVRASGLEHMAWDIQIITAPEVMDVDITKSGQLLLHTGILDTATSDDELAAVLSHEIAHILANHSAQERSMTWLIGTIHPILIPFGLLGEIAEALTLTNLSLVPFWLPIIGVVAGTYFVISGSRESEADYIGLILMADAGFDPSAAVTLWKKLSIIAERKLQELRRQHPRMFETKL